MVPSTYISPSTLVEVHAFLQGGRRYFSRREITALVGGPGNMAVYRHKLVIPPTAKVLSPKNENRLPPKHYRRIALPLKKYRRILVLPLPPEKYRQLSIPPKEYCQLSRPPERYRQHWIPPKRYRRHWMSPKRYRRYWIEPKRYRVHWIPPKTYRLFFSCSFFVLCSFWFFGFLFGRNS